MSGNGFKVTNPCGVTYMTEEEHATDREHFRTCLQEVDDAIRFLNRCDTRKTLARSRGSYGLKHCAENLYGNNYLCNGALIAAVIHLGLKYKRDGEDSPNITVGVKVPPQLETHPVRRGMR